MSTKALLWSHPGAPNAWSPAHGQAPPECLYVRGRLPVSPAVALVGARQASTPAIRFARALAYDLAVRGVSVWSGGAVGIDAAAHRGALDAGGPTVVVLAGGLDRPYPKENAQLFDRVLAGGGALCSLYPDGTPSKPRYFLQRNELIAAAGQLTVVVQAGVRSGARSTAAAARRLGRVVAAVPHAPWDSQGAGCAAELALGAIPVAGARDVWGLLARCLPDLSPFVGEERSAQVGRAPRAKAPCLVGVVEEALWPHLCDEPAHVDVLCERTGLPARRVSSALLTMALRAVVVEGPGGCYRRA